VTNWFSYEVLAAQYPYKKVQNADLAQITYVDNILIPTAMSFVQGYTGIRFGDNPPEDILLVTKNYAVNLILGDDETIKIAQSRGQPSVTVAGDTISLDLSPGSNPYLSTEDEMVLDRYRDTSDSSLHIDKVRVRSQGTLYRDARGRTDQPSAEYVQHDLSGPWYLRP
jgi:hypothetical protein